MRVSAVAQPKFVHRGSLQFHGRIHKVVFAADEDISAGHQDIGIDMPVPWFSLRRSEVRTAKFDLDDPDSISQIFGYERPSDNPCRFLFVRCLLEALYKQVCDRGYSVYEARTLACQMPCIKASSVHQEFIHHQCRQFKRFVRTLQTQRQMLTRMSFEDYLAYERMLPDDPEFTSFKAIVTQYELLDEELLKCTSSWLFCSMSPWQHIERWIFGIPLPFCTEMHTSYDCLTHPLHICHPKMFADLNLVFVGVCEPGSSTCTTYSRADCIVESFSHYTREFEYLPDLDLKTIAATYKDDLIKILSSRPLVSCIKKPSPSPRYDGIGRNLFRDSTDLFSVRQFLLHQGEVATESHGARKHRTKRQEDRCCIM